MKELNLIVILLLISILSYGQGNDKLANDYFKKKFYPVALKEFQKLVKKYPSNPEYNFKLAVCYLETNIDKKAALALLEKVKESKRFDIELHYYLGVSYALHYRFDDAIKSLDTYLESPKEFEKEARKRKNDCYAAKKLIKNPVNVSFKNMGSRINTEYPDYYPFISGDETLLAFTSRRKKSKGGMDVDGYYFADVFLSSFNGNAFSIASIMGSFNTTYDEQCTGLSADGSTMFFYSNYKEDDGELYLVEEKGSSFGKRTKLEFIDDDKKVESSVCLSPNGMVMIYASNKDKGLGGYDLYMVRKLPFGENLWAEPQNMGDVVNSPGDEDFPSFGPDGKTIYFASNGHPGMGGWDLFKVVWDPENNTFSAPKNLGHPLNTPDDERSISFASDGKHAYISALREEGLGDLDIYRITYEDVLVSPAIFKYSCVDSSGNPIEADMFSVIDSNGDIVGDYSPNPNNNLYTLILAPGTYDIEIDATAAGYEFHSERLVVTEFLNRKGRIEKRITLTKQ